MNINSSIQLMILFFLMISCSKSTVEKPENLIREDKMIKMLTDVHLAEATFKSRRYLDSIVAKSSSANFYYSVLEKYQVPDSVFEKSLLYYTSQPRKFEKMYRQIMNNLNELEQEFTGPENDLIELEIDK